VRWGLPPDYPMVASSYAEQRSALAKRIGLGVRRGRRGTERATSGASALISPARLRPKDVRP
jgi:predicted transcriptional regulator